MGYASCICRVGALAVALGVGAAVTGIPAVGYAAPETSGASSTDSSSTTSQSSADSTGAPSSSGAGQPSPANTESADSSDGDTPSTSSANAAGSSTVTAVGAGGEHASNATDADSASDSEVVVDEIEAAASQSSSTAGEQPDTADDAGATVPSPHTPETHSAPTNLGAPTVATAAADPDSPAPDVTGKGSAPAVSLEEAAPITADTPHAPDIEILPAAAAYVVPHAEPSSAVGSSGSAQGAPSAVRPPVVSGVGWPVSALSDVAQAVFAVASDLVSAALGPLVGDTSSPLVWAMLAFARREIGDIGQTLTAVLPGAGQLAAVQTLGLPDITNPGSWLGWLEGLVSDAQYWANTYVDFYPWWSGGLIYPEFLRGIVFNHTPVAAPMQVELDLSAGVTSAAIPFVAYDADGNALVYSVPARGLPGGPEHGTVSIDNAAGTFTYTPDADFFGTDSFAFIVSDDTSPHLHAWDNLLNAAFGLLNTSLDGGHTDTAIITVFNNLDIRPDPDLAAYTDITGDFSVLTYNVAGLPFPLSGGAWPRIPNTLQIGSRINDFDIVNVQQDIAYHPFLIANTAFPDQTAPSAPTWAWPVGIPFSDGLNSFAAYDIEGLTRHGWTSGANPLDPAGFTYSRMHIPGGSSIDVYNIDTSGGALTNTDLAQLSDFITHNSVGRAVIVTGDFGQLYSDPGQTLTTFAAANGLTDAWLQLEYPNGLPPSWDTCAYADSCEQTDKIFYRSATGLDPDDPTSSPVQLSALTYTNEGLNFQNSAGQDLSNHRPQAVTFGYSLDAVGPMNVDTANWMADLPGIDNLSLTQLPIPGTHDSGTYSVTSGSEWARTGISDFGILTQLPGFIQDLFVKPIAASWSKTQQGDLYQQFSDGIRYVDLRLSNEPDGKVYIEHGLRGPQIDEVLDDIAAFANDHPKEVLVIGVNRMTNFSQETNDLVLAKIRAAFGSRMVPRSVGTSASLGDLWAIDKNVIVVYNDYSEVDDNANLWFSTSIFGRWANAQTVGPLLTSNRSSLADRNPWEIWDMSGTVTPDTGTVVTGILTLGPTTIEQLMWAVHPSVQDWIRGEFKSSVNLVTTDWYESFWPEGSSYTRDVIGAVYETLGSRLSATSPTP